MKDKTWTWIDSYGAWLRPKLPRLCMKCRYKGYFKLKEIKVPTPTWPFIEVCPKCGNQVECEGIEANSIFSKQVEKLAKRFGKSPQELADEVFNNIIMEFNHKTGKVRFIRKDTGEEIWYI